MSTLHIFKTELSRAAQLDAEAKESTKRAEKTEEMVKIDWFLIAVNFSF